MPLTPCFFYEHEFDSRRRYKANTWIPLICAKLKAKEYKNSDLKLWRFRLVARTHASHAWNTGSIPVGATSSVRLLV